MKIKETIENILKNIQKFLLKLVGYVANGINQDYKYQRLILFTLLIIILIFIYFFVNLVNPFNIKELADEKKYDNSDFVKKLNYYNKNPNTSTSYENKDKDFSVMTKKEIVLTLFLSGIALLTFLFFVYRNNNRKSEEYYSYNNNNFTKDEDKKDKSSNKFNDYLLKPLLQLFKFTGVLISVILIPFIFISLIFYCFHQFNITYFILLYLFGFLSLVTIGSIIIKLIPELNTIYSEFKKSFEKTKTPTSPPQTEKSFFDIIKTFILFLPCLLILIADSIQKDFKSTPSSVFILLIFLLILITSIFALPILYRFINTVNQNDLLSGKGPLYLNKKTILGYYQNLNKKNIYNYNLTIPKKDPLTDINNDIIDREIKQFENSGYDLSKIDKYKDHIKKNKESKLINLYDNPILKNKMKLEKAMKGFSFKLFKEDLFNKYNVFSIYNPYHDSKGKNPFNYTYSLSFYLYLNPQDTNTNISYTENAEILNYAEKPVIFYNGKSREIIIKSRTFNNKGDQLDTIYKTDQIKYQKWNYFVINYDDNIIDVFINGELVGSKKNVSPYLVGDYVSVGQDNGIYGSIKELFYYNKTIPPDDIEFLSKLLKN